MQCPHCRSANPNNANFCSHCGARLTPVASAPVADGSMVVGLLERAPDGERKLITALIADIKDSVALLGALDPEHADRIVHSVLGIMIDSVLKFEGHVVQPTGDGIYAVFGAPVAAQDHAQRAVHAALEMQRRLRAYAERRRDNEPLVEVRAGIESGEVVVRNIETGQGSVYTTVGQTVNLAARLQSVATPGSVSIGEQARRLVEGYFNLRPRPPAAVKGVPQPIAVYEVIGPGKLQRHSQISGRRQFSKLVGRDAQLQQMRGALDRAIDRRGQVVAVVAAAGMGKSRLILEFTRALPPACKIIEAYATSYAKRTPWFPIIGMLQDYFGISDHDDPATRRAKIESALAPLLPDLNEIRPLLFGLLGIVDGPDPLGQMDPGVRRDRIIDAIVRILLAESDMQPVAVIVEDLHWIDDQTRALLVRLASGIGSARILLLASYRPEYVPNWSDEVAVTQITLEPLSPEETGSLLSSLVGENSDLSDLKRHICDRAGGNPFFVEEMVNAMFEDGTLTRSAVVHVTKSISDLNVPMTVRGVLLERVDQMAPLQKELLQILAVIGQTLPLTLVLKIAPWPEPEIVRLMNALQSAGFIFALSDASQGANWIQYAFKHVLTQEVAYQSMLGARRKLLHRSVARALESIYGDFLDDQIAVIAHHYGAADDHPKAIEYLGRAGQQAVQRAAHGDAIGFFREALRRVDLVGEEEVPPARRAALWSSLGISLLVTNGYAHDEVGLAYRRAREFSIAAGDDNTLGLVLRGNFLFHLSRAEYKAALEAGQELVELGNRNDAYLTEGYIGVAILFIYISELHKAESYFSLALKNHRETLSSTGLQHTGHSNPMGHVYHGICLSYLGKFEQALSESDVASKAAEALSTPITIAQTLAAKGATLQRLRYYDAAETCYDQAIACSNAHGLPYWVAFSSMARAALQGERAAPEAAFEEFERSRREYQGSGARLMMSWFLYLRAGLLAKSGRLEEALECVEETTRFIAETGETVFEAEVRRLKGMFLLERRRQTEAEACFLDSLDIARRQHAGLWELRAAISLACLYGEHGRQGAALDLLCPVRDGLATGVETPDLADARHLIHALQHGVPWASPNAGSALLPRREPDMAV